MKSLLVRFRHFLRSLEHTSSRVLSTTPSSSSSSFSSSSSSRVDTSIENGVARVALNRPEKLNAVDLAMFHAIRDSILHLQQQQNSVRVVLLSGKGRAFCSGLDVPSLFGIGNINPLQAVKTLLDRSNENQIANLAQEVAFLWRQLPVPVIAVLHGACLGAGLQIALGADVRVATADAKLAILESKWGLIPDMSASVTLRELVRIDVAKELTFTGRIVSGSEAAQLGLVTHVVETNEEAIQKAEMLAKQIIDRSPDSVALAKRLYQETWVKPEEECLRLETDFQRKLLATWNQLAASSRNFGLKLPYFSIKHDK